MDQSLSYQARAKLSQSSAAKRLLQLMEDKKTNLSLSADVTSAKELLYLAEQLGPQICLLKTHIDIIQDFSFDLIKQLRALAEQHQFMIFEDRKFADIGHTVKHQYQGGMYRIVEWADFINAHVLPGPGIIQGLREVGKEFNRGLILLAEMSSKGHLMNADYQQKTLAMAEQFPDFVMGFITQHAISSAAHWINLSPGIQLETGGDALGQQYTTPKTAILEHGTDIIIVGRGIIAAENPIHAAEIYRQQAYDAYQQRLLKA